MTKPRRTKSEVMRLRTEMAVFGGCCDRFADHSGCNCLEEADMDIAYAERYMLCGLPVRHHDDPPSKAFVKAVGKPPIKLPPIASDTEVDGKFPKGNPLTEPLQESSTWASTHTLNDDGTVEAVPHPWDHPPHPQSSPQRKVGGMADRRIIMFDYRNHKGHVSSRRVRPIRIWYGATAYQREGGWLLEAFDLDKQETRDFAMSGMLSPWLEIGTSEGGCRDQGQG